MMIRMNADSNKKVRPGVALLIVLFIVMAITILSLGFVTRSDVELACGQNMLMRTQMDYLAESGLEHARGLILNPQDITDSTYSYWRGGTGLQLVSGNDYYDVKVTRNASDLCNYNIDCNSYRLEGAETIGQSSLQATLRIDPCIAYWAGSSAIVTSAMIINGDVYCNGNLTNNGNINGDIFAAGTISGTDPAGQKKSAAEAGVTWPNITILQNYYIEATNYSANIIDANLPLSSSVPTVTNPAGVCYSNSDVDMLGGVTINGTLVVTGNLTIEGTNTITAVKSFPALVVGGKVVMKNNSSLTINGLAQVEQQITEDPGSTTATLQVYGGLFINSGSINSNVISVNINADPAIASIEIWTAINTASRWSPAAGAFFRSIERK